MEAPKPPPPTKQLTNAEIEKKVKSLMDELISVQDSREAIACVEELKCGEKMSHVVETILLHVLERSPTARELSGRLCLDLVREGLLTPDQFVSGSSLLLTEAEDFLVDIPCLFKYMGEIFGGLISSSDHFPLKHFAKFCETLGPRHAGKFLAATLKCAEKSLGQQTLANCWRSAALKLDALLGVDAANDFLASNGLSFLESPVNDKSNIPSSSTPSTSTSLSSSSSRAPVNLSQFANELQNRLKRDRNDEDIKMWIIQSVGEEMVKDHQFIRILMTATVSVAVTGEGTMASYKSEELKRHSKLLQHFFNEDSTLETQAVYALQKFVNDLQHPPGLLQNIFDTCYDEDVISEAAFRAWYDADAEEDGKGVSKLSVVNFFKWLNEAEDEDADASVEKDK